jgi:hypothetical protein
MLNALNDAGAEYLIVGAYALAAHGLMRSTGDIDIWVRPTPENADRVWKALRAFGAPLSRVSPADFHTPDVVYQIGVAPWRIDIITSITAVEFEHAWGRRLSSEYDGIRATVLSRDDLLVNKRAAGRGKDMLDVAWLEGRE